MSEARATVLVTGASGLLGAALVTLIEEYPGLKARAAYRIGAAAFSAVDGVAIGDIGPDTDWAEALAGCRAVVHCAARAHVLREGADAAVEYERVNISGTMALAEQAEHSGIEHFIFISSAGVHGSENQRPVDESEILSPIEPYAISKLEAERQLRSLAQHSPMGVTILRPPLIYGPRAKGNMERLTRLVLSGLPLPIASVDNRRSLVGVSNLCSAIIACLENRCSMGKTYLVTDQADLSTAQLARDIASAAGKRAVLFHMPPRMLEMGARLVGREKLYKRLVGNLTFDSGAISRDLGWKPTVQPTYDLRGMVQWFVCSQRGARH